MKKILAFLNQWIFLFLLWLAFTTSLQLQELITGFFVSLFVTIITISLVPWGNFILFNPVRLFYFLVYIPVFIWAMIKANLDVAWRVVQPKIPLNPGIVKLKTDLDSDIGKLLLTNSITLTPGTISFQVNNKDLYIHWIDVNTQNKQEQKKEIFESFEKILKKVTE